MNYEFDWDAIDEQAETATKTSIAQYEQRLPCFLPEESKDVAMPLQMAKDGNLWEWTGEIESPRFTPKKVFDIRHYQRLCQEAIFKDFTDNIDGHYLIQMATGTGKTIVMAMVINHLLLHNQKAIVIAHTEELLGQTVDKLVSYGACNESEIEIVQQSIPDPSKKVWVCSIQTIARGEKRLKLMCPDLVIVDECHHLGGTYAKVFNYYGKPLLGFTATATERTEARRKILASIYDKISYQYPIRQGIKEGYLANIIYYRVKTGVDISNVKTVMGDFDNEELSLACDVQSRNEKITDKYLEVGGGKALVFGINVKHCFSLNNFFKTKGLESYVVYGETPEDERKNILDKFQKSPMSQNFILVNCMVLTEGYDCPDIRVLIDTMPTKSPGRYIQKLGRGTRIVPGLKKEIIVIDIADNYKNKKLCNALTTIFELSDDCNMQGNIAKQLAEKEENGLLVAKAGEKREKSSSMDEEMPQEDYQIEIMNILFSMPIEVESSKVAFFSPKNNSYIAYLDKQNFVEIRDLGLSYEVYENFNKVLETKEISQALAHCENVAKQYPETSYIWDTNKRNANKQEKPSPAQAKWLKSIAPNIDCSKISKDTASQIISAHVAKSGTTKATDKQRYFLYRHLPKSDVDNMSKSQASREIAKIKNPAKNRNYNDED